MALRGSLPDDPELTFAHHEAIVALEEMMQGSHLSPAGLSPTGQPLTLRYRRSPRPTEGLNPALISPEYADLYLREGVLSLNVIAVSHVAVALAPSVETGPRLWFREAQHEDWYGELVAGATALRDQVRAWVVRANPDPELGRLLDSFVHRLDKDLVIQLAATMETTVRPEERPAVWSYFDRQRSLEEKRLLLSLSSSQLVDLANGPAES
ncbi:hypothetical protein [Pseudofrankia inefficax]|uniref:Uncharacterized protein n=1 Tax=Pseudofrankia inefficax (strain DSM 45817 / CECT 9037 / DDB 130130 / EuI1c) TaxID=298654 RepID=E3J809_PSEI1|nr:hypothetical protein [Pseudofrankia inefficax]ADP82057.1 hypothetical protein FraEuI1c_4056 [Pseudofrankia inefficax]